MLTCLENLKSTMYRFVRIEKLFQKPVNKKENVIYFTSYLQGKKQVQHCSNLYMCTVRYV